MQTLGNSVNPFHDIESELAEVEQRYASVYEARDSERFPHLMRRTRVVNKSRDVSRRTADHEEIDV